jgi:hypothetical protein
VKRMRRKPTRVIVHPLAGERSCGSCKARKRTVEANEEGQIMDACE